MDGGEAPLQQAYMLCCMRSLTVPPACRHLDPCQEGAEFSFTPLELALAVPAGAFCAWYYAQKHWFANNVLGLAFRYEGPGAWGYCTREREGAAAA